MAEEKELSQEELKAKEYVDFYYFWLFHYCGRNYRREIDKRLTPRAETVYSDRCTANWPEFLATQDRQKNTAVEMYLSHPLSSMHPQFSPDEDFTDTDNLFFQDCASDEYPSTLLEILHEGRQLCKNIELVKSLGMEILGTCGASVSTEGYLRGSIIARIDLNAPISSLLYELSKLKKARFESFPNFLDAPPIVGIPGDYLHQKDMIQQTTNSSFAVKDDAPRAIGLWFWDSIEGPYTIFDSFAGVWKAVCGEALPGVQYEEMEKEDIFRTVSLENNPQKTWAVPTGKLFAKLGYFSSDPSVFRRLYRNTKRCIDACEVLSLKD